MIVTWDLAWEHPQAQQLMHLAKQAADELAAYMGLPEKCEVAVVLTDDVGIQQLNRDMRGINEPTDVLSFPHIRWKSPLAPGAKHVFKKDADTGNFFLGDMAISGQRIAAQAAEFGHGFAREGSYMVVHSLLHLLGYDHGEEGQKKVMRELEEKIMQKVALSQ